MIKAHRKRVSPLGFKVTYWNQDWVKIRVWLIRLKLVRATRHLNYDITAKKELFSLSSIQSQVWEKCINRTIPLAWTLNHLSLLFKLRRMACFSPKIALHYITKVVICWYSLGPLNFDIIWNSEFWNSEKNIWN